MDVVSPYISERGISISDLSIAGIVVHEKCYMSHCFLHFKLFLTFPFSVCDINNKVISFRVYLTNTLIKSSLFVCFFLSLYDAFPSINQLYYCYYCYHYLLLLLLPLLLISLFLLLIIDIPFFNVAIVL